jgi:hypothetical protein
VLLSESSKFKELKASPINTSCNYSSYGSAEALLEKQKCWSRNFAGAAAMLKQQLRWNSINARRITEQQLL